MSKSPATGVPEQVLREALATEPRRRLVDCLAAEGSMAVTDLAACMAGTESGVDPEGVPPDRHRAVRTALFEDHLPALTETEVVEFDSLRAEVSLADPRALDCAGR